MLRIVCEALAVWLGIASVVRTLNHDPLTGLYLILLAIFVVKLWQIGDDRG